MNQLPGMYQPEMYPGIHSWGTVWGKNGYGNIIREPITHKDLEGNTISTDILTHGVIPIDVSKIEEQGRRTRGGALLVYRPRIGTEICLYKRSRIIPDGTIIRRYYIRLRRSTVDNDFATDIIASFEESDSDAMRNGWKKGNHEAGLLMQEEMKANDAVNPDLSVLKPE
ncbi:uncharacterized protein LOC130944389 [Arachis stenosperma]|uniref:uncharacterized protein LOC130944389 n=1 Tax=Arachis stenosperma TaxID=217475 RepID=UPI0025ABD5AE|nr:uncharacterized protein LOC130944389 [Arachis stenosperma]